MSLTEQYAVKDDITQITSRIIRAHFSMHREPAPIYTIGNTPPARRKRYVVCTICVAENRHTCAALDKLGESENEGIQIRVHEELNFEFEGDAYMLKNWAYIIHKTGNGGMLLYLRCDTFTINGEEYDMAKLIALRLQGASSL